jgi:hypothetical protein
LAGGNLTSTGFADCDIRSLIDPTVAPDVDVRNANADQTLARLVSRRLYPGCAGALDHCREIPFRPPNAQVLVVGRLGALFGRAVRSYGPAPACTQPPCARGLGASSPYARRAADLDFAHAAPRGAEIPCASGPQAAPLGAFAAARRAPRRLGASTAPGEQPRGAFSHSRRWAGNRRRLE